MPRSKSFDADRILQQVEHFKSQQARPIHARITELERGKVSIDREIAALHRVLASLGEKVTSNGTSVSAVIRSKPGKPKGKRTRRTQAEMEKERQQLAQDGEAIFDHLKKQKGEWVRAKDLMTVGSLGRPTDALMGYIKQKKVIARGMGIAKEFSIR